MKRTILTLITLWLVLWLHAKSDSLHQKFKGVPIDGTRTEFVEKMKLKGFSFLGTYNNVDTLRGDFAAFKDCLVCVSTLKHKDLVYSITVRFPECDTWSALSEDYYSLKGMLTEKYGNPSETTEMFQNDGLPDDFNKFFFVKSNQCKYYSTFRTHNGTIQLKIDHKGRESCFVSLTYSDSINCAIIRSHAIDDL